MANRKIFFFDLRLVSTDTQTPDVDQSLIPQIFDHISSLESYAYTPTNKKAHYLKNVSNHESMKKLIFETAEIGYRPEVLDLSDGSRRDNPRKPSEGEVAKTHAVIGQKFGNYLMLFEQSTRGVAKKSIQQFFNNMAIRFFTDNAMNTNVRFEVSALAREDFLEHLEKMRYVNFGSISFNKSMLGSTVLGFAGNDDNIERELSLNMKAKKGRDLKSLIRTAFTAMKNNPDKANQILYSIRVKGQDEFGKSLTLNTEFMERYENIPVELNSITGLVNSANIFANLVGILDRL